MADLALNPPAYVLLAVHPLRTDAGPGRVEAVYHAFRQHHAKRVNARWAALAEQPYDDRWQRTPFARYVVCLNGRLLQLAATLEQRLSAYLPEVAVVDRVVELVVNGRVYAYRGIPIRGGPMWARYTWHADNVVRVSLPEEDTQS